MREQSAVGSIVALMGTFRFIAGAGMPPRAKPGEPRRENEPLPSVQIAPSEQDAAPAKAVRTKHPGVWLVRIPLYAISAGLVYLAVLDSMFFEDPLILISSLMAVPFLAAALLFTDWVNAP